MKIRLALLALAGSVLALLGASPAIGDPANPVGRWDATGSMNEVRGSWYIGAQPAAVVLRDGRVLVAGGRGEELQPLASAELYDPDTGVWTPTGSMNVGREAQTMSLLPDGRVLASGGLGWNYGTNTFAGYMSSAEVYDPATGTWSLVAPMQFGREAASATLLGNGKVLVAGGVCCGPASPGIRSAELYDSGSGTWTRAGDMPEGHSDHTATLLRDGRVLVAGGAGVVKNGNGAPNGKNAQPNMATALYDPASDTWSQGPDTAYAVRLGHTATLLPNGQVLVAGGFPSSSGVPVKDAQLYDPVANTWKKTHSMTDPRERHTATLLPDGRVLVAGGINAQSVSGCCPLASAELYDWTTGTWAPAADMPIPRAIQLAALLPSGKVLIAGGLTFSPTGSGAAWTTTSELYTP